MLDFSQGSLGTFLKEKLQDFQPEMISYEYGTVFSCADGIVRISGLSHAQYGELLRFENDVYGIALDTSLEGVGAALLSRGASVRPGSRVQGTGRVADIGVGKELLGRVVDPIGRPLDGHPLTVRAYRQVESPAPAIMDRSPVDTPMETGILAVDSMIPIGRGQRELIIGDRQTGKT
ncbi:MAG TPA: F0F1 ATP synthase subunit alpha, partial [Candidatus Faecousia intestinavium]|nr:F0F1 ATP synthase subunit alpha [Candidatus Faecousia intestinavium]